MKSYKVTTCIPYSYKELDEEVFTDLNAMLEYVKDNEAYVVGLEELETTDIYDKYVNLNNKDHYRVDVNVMGDDEWNCSYVDDQWNYLVLASSKKEAEKKALELANNRLEETYETYKYLEVVNTVKVKYNNKNRRWE